jgi:hypothetical protein
MRSFVNPTFLVREALVLLASAPRNDELTGIVNFRTSRMILFAQQDTALSLDAFSAKYLKPEIEEWALEMPRHARLGLGEPASWVVHESFKGVGMLGCVSDRTDDRKQLTLQVFPQGNGA